MKTNAAFILICGGGKLPYLVAKEMEISRKKFILLILKESRWDKRLKNFNIKLVRLGNIITELKKLKNEYDNIILAGSLTRPSIKDLKPDFNTLKLIPRLTKIFLEGGDNRLLSFLVNELESMKFRVNGIKSIIPNLFELKVIKTIKKPNQVDLKNIERGTKILNILSSFDIGQSIIIQQGNVLGIEAAEGTDVLIKRTKKLIKNGDKPILIKLLKQNQDCRVDLPTLGIKTVELCNKSNIKGIAYSYNNTVLIEKEKIIERMNKFKMFLFGIRSV